MSLISQSIENIASGNLFLKKQYVFILFFICILFATSCAKKNEHFTHDPLSFNVGDTVTLELSHIPDGLSANDFKWSIGSATGADSGLKQLSEGTFCAEAPGSGIISAKASYHGVAYTEWFNFDIYPLSGMELNHLTLNLLTGDTYTDLAVTLPENGMNSGAVTWSISDTTAGLIELQPNGTDSRHTEISLHVFSGIDATYPQNVKVTATWGNIQAHCMVTVYDSRSPEQLLAYINVGGLNGFYKIEGKTVILDDPHSNLDLIYDETVSTVFAKVPKGKYAVIEKGMLGLGYMAILPPKYLPVSFSEVAYLIKAQAGEPIHICNYENGVKGMQPTIDIILMDAATGETLKVYETLYGDGNFPEKVFLMEDASVYYSAEPSDIEIEAALMRVISSLWAQEDILVVNKNGTTP